MIIPIAQISIAGPIYLDLPLSDSGAIYIIEFALNYSELNTDTPEMPKSTIFTSNI